MFQALILKSYNSYMSPGATTAPVFNNSLIKGVIINQIVKALPLLCHKLVAVEVNALKHPNLREIKQY